MKRIPLVLLVALVYFSSCRKENIDIDSSASLSFSADTIMFDTVFTAIGSTTKSFTVTNKSSKGTIKLDRIRLAGGSDSNFRLNINGVQSSMVEDVEIFPGDSLYVFVEVTVDPNGANSPMVIEDSIEFHHNNKIQDINLVAFGQDYHLINGEFISSATWYNDKPYLIYNSMAVDSAETLVIEKGCQLHFHHQSSMYVLGSLQVKGTVDEPVVFQGDRLEMGFDNVPGQWGHIRLLVGSFDNSIDYAIIKNAIIGIQVDSFPVIGPSLKLSNSRIENMTAVGLYGLGAKVQANNCSFNNCGQSALELIIGGDYQFYHCTIGNYYAYGNRVAPSVLINNYYEDVNGNYNVRAIENAYFANCIVYGDKEAEIGLDMFPGTEGAFNYRFEKCLLKVDPDMEINESRIVDCLLNQDPFFIDPGLNNFELDTLSVAKDVADITTAQFFPVDLNGISRLSDEGPDLGAFERVE